MAVRLRDGYSRYVIMDTLYMYIYMLYYCGILYNIYMLYYYGYFFIYILYYYGILVWKVFGYIQLLINLFFSILSAINCYKSLNIITSIY